MQQRAPSQTRAPAHPRNPHTTTTTTTHSTALFVFGYCVYYYFARSGMSGFMQAAFFFGYNGLACYAFFLMLGAVGWRASLLFVRQIYKAVKCE